MVGQPPALDAITAGEAWFCKSYREEWRASDKNATIAGGSKRALVAAMIVNSPPLTSWHHGLKRLEAHPGSVVLIAVEQPELQLRSRRVSREERKALKAALEKARKKREQANQAQT